MNSDYILEMKNITKEFPGVKALDNVTFSVKKGEIHALCGENGAGKSTLMKVLSGVYQYGTYDGQIKINGVEKKFESIKESQEAGIAIIYQELALVPELSVAENIFLSHELMRKKIINWDKIYAESQKWLEYIGLDIDPQEQVKNLTVGKQQLIEIAKSLTRNTELLILDEPTAALTESDVELLKGILRDLKDKGVTCIYISHKLNEVLDLADNVTILRDGQSITTLPREGLTENEIVTNMVGRELSEMFPYEPREIGEKVLELKDYSVWNPNAHRPIIDKANLTLKKGEILGLSGLIGAGRSELFMSLFGVKVGKNKSGQVIINGDEVSIDSPADAIKNGIGYVSEDRKRYGLVLGMDIIKNTSLVTINNFTKKKIINSEEELHNVEQVSKKMKLKASNLESIVGTLSGGNQQKVVLSKWLLGNPQILILDEPTRGIDVGAKYEIYKIINELAESGVSIVIISSELPEVLGISDRILVMSEGKVTGEFSREEATEEKIMALATGGRENGIIKE